MPDEMTFSDAELEQIKKKSKLQGNDFEVFMDTAKRYGLNPLANQIHGRAQGGQLLIITGIDGYRLIAERTGKYAGNDDPVITLEKPMFTVDPKFLLNGQDVVATATVYKIVNGTRCGFTSTARWSQYYPGAGGAGHMWRKMPHLMLGKCAEALALRKSFPDNLSGIYTEEEMHQADRPKAGGTDGVRAFEPEVATGAPAPNTAGACNHCGQRDGRHQLNCPVATNATTATDTTKPAPTTNPATGGVVTEDLEGQEMMDFDKPAGHPNTTPEAVSGDPPDSDQSETTKPQSLRQSFATALMAWAPCKATELLEVAMPIFWNCEIEYTPGETQLDDEHWVRLLKEVRGYIDGQVPYSEVKAFWMANKDRPHGDDGFDTDLIEDGSGTEEQG